MSDIADIVALQPQRRPHPLAARHLDRRLEVAVRLFEQYLVAVARLYARSEDSLCGAYPFRADVIGGALRLDDETFGRKLQHVRAPIFHLAQAVRRGRPRRAVERVDRSEVCVKCDVPCVGVGIGRAVIDPVQIRAACAQARARDDHHRRKQDRKKSFHDPCSCCYFPLFTDLSLCLRLRRTSLSLLAICVITSLTHLSRSLPSE